MAPHSSYIARVLTVEDFEPYRRFVSSLLKTRPQLQVIAEASGGLEAIAKAQEFKPDVVLMDIGLPELNGIEAARRIRITLPETKIIFLTQEPAREVVHEAITLGASGYILKSEAELHLLPALEAVITGKRFFHGEVVSGTGPFDGNGHRGPQE